VAIDIFFLNKYFLFILKHHDISNTTFSVKVHLVLCLDLLGDCFATGVIISCGEGVLCGMRNFEKVYFPEFHLLNVPQITP